MNHLSLYLMWCSVQVTLICLVAVLLGGLLRRWGHRIQPRVAHTALLVVLVLTAFAFSPWPRWSMPGEQRVTVVPTGVVPGDLLIPSRSPDGAERASDPSQPADPARLSYGFADWRSGVSSLESLAQSLSGYVLPLLMLSVIVGTSRFVTGWRIMRRLRHEARPVDDPRCRQLLDDLCRQLHCQCPVALRSSTEIGTPATVGWRTPMILLPADWPRWSDDELRAVLAHELAHIVRHDFLRLAAAQLSVVFHFYHPLVHYLLDQVRMEQELAADATAAELAGGRQTYLMSLAAMALRSDHQPVAWPARTFLPDPGAFARRIEMLKDRSAASLNASPSSRIATVSLVLVAGLIAFGLRPEAAPAQNAKTLRGEQKPSQDKDDDPVRADVRRSMNHAKTLGLAMHLYHQEHGHFPAAAVEGPGGVRHSWRVALLPHLDAQDLYEQYRLDEPWDSPHNKQLLKKIPEIYRAPRDGKDSSNASVFVLTGEGTPFDGGDGAKFEQFRDGLSNTLLIVESKRDIPWTKPEDVAYEPGRRPELGGWYDKGFVAVFADGAAHFLTEKIPDQTLHDVIRLADGNVIDPDKLHPRD